MEDLRLLEDRFSARFGSRSDSGLVLGAWLSRLAKTLLHLAAKSTDSVGFNALSDFNENPDMVGTFEVLSTFNQTVENNWTAH